MLHKSALEIATENLELTDVSEELRKFKTTVKNTSVSNKSIIHARLMHIRAFVSEKGDFELKGVWNDCLSLVCGSPRDHIIL